MKIDYEAIIRAYNEGESLNSIADAFGTYPTTVKRILEKQGVELRHDARHKGSYCVKDGEKLLAWAKAQGRLVTQAELAAVIGTKRLSPSYFMKYPELGHYVKSGVQTEFQEYYDKLYNWLQTNNIQYKPGDRRALKMSVDALLLGEYSNLILHIAEKPKFTSIKKHETSMKLRSEKAKAVGKTVIFLSKEHFDNLDEIKGLLDDLKN
jgi:hypothetical protein